MSSWIDKYKKLVIPSHKRHIILADPDDLFAYAELRQAFENEGYTTRRCKTDLAVRLVFELQVRNSDKKYLLIAPETYRPLPDIEWQAHFQSIGLPHLFPNLDAKAIKGLSFNALRLLSNIKHYENLGYEKTLKFLLENLYNVDFDALTNSKAKERIINALITVFLEKDDANDSIVKFLTTIASPYFPTLASQGLSHTSLIGFIQAQWQTYLNTGDSLLDFNEPLLNKNLGYLFECEYLTPIRLNPEAYDALPKPLRIGAYVDEARRNDDELESLTEYLKQQLETIEDIHDQWFKIIRILANAKLKYISSTDAPLKEAYQTIENAFNVRFQRFIDNTYDSSFSLSGVRNPVVVSRILEHIHASHANKKALLIIDGMNYWQAVILGRVLNKAGIEYSSHASLAFIPTITAWSRQAIFKGSKPDITDDNSQEAKLFEAFWSRHRISARQVVYKKFGVHAPLRPDDIPDDVTMLGLVCNDLDDIMHGSILGNSQLKTSTEQWILQSGIAQSIATLRAKGFQVYITADHGNVEATGLKSLTMQDKIGTLSRGKRHLHFTNETLLQSFVEQNPNVEVGKKGLSLYLRKQEAFTTTNSQVITHGGSHIWEVIVPFIKINAQ